MYKRQDVDAGMVRTISKRQRRCETLNEWARSTKGRETFLYIPNIRDRINLPLNTNHYATQYLSGHGNFNSKLFGFRLSEDPWCARCGVGVEETAWHVIAECPAYVNERQKLIDLWQEHPGEDRREILCWNATYFKIFARVARKVGRTKEGKGIVEHEDL